MSILLRANRVDVDVDSDFLANSGNRFRSCSKHQAKGAPFEGLGRDLPMRLLKIASGRAQQNRMKGNGPCHAMHGEVASDIAGLWTSLFDAATSECDLGKLCYIEKFRAAQMVVTLGNSSINTADRNPSYKRRILDMIAVDLDRAIELLKLANGGAEKMTDFESDCRMGLIELVGFIRDHVRNEERRCRHQ